MKYYDCLYLDKEKDIVIEFYKEKGSFFYLLRTPNHKSGNLITNLARICDLEISYDENGLKAVKGKVPSFINEENERIHILKFNNKTVAVINEEGEIKARAQIPAISKTLMSQSKECKLDLNKTLVRTYIEEDYKFRSDVHTHMNANLYPDILIALGIYHQIKYPYYYILKLGLRLSESQEKKILAQREKVERRFSKSGLSGKYRERRINDNTFINFADLILNNIENASYNIERIRASLTILKDGQAVFTNLEKLYLYRYVFTKGQEVSKKIKLRNISKIPDKDIREYLKRMLQDARNDDYKDNTLLEDKLLWIGRMYAHQGIRYVEISNTALVKNSDEPLELLESCHRILPLVEKETGVRIRFLVALRRIPLTIIKDKVTPENYLRDNLDVLKAVALDPYVVGSDFVGEEINDIRELKPVISELVEYCRKDPTFTIRIHAGESDYLTNNVADSIDCVIESLGKKQKMPKMRIGHGLHTPSLSTAKGKKLIERIRDNNVILEFQMTSNVRLNNLTVLENHPLKEYLRHNVKAIQGTDGCGIYGTNSLDEQLALTNLLKMSRNDIAKIIKVENEVMESSARAFASKSRRFDKLRNGRSITETLKDEIRKNKEVVKRLDLNTTDKYYSEEVLKDQIKELPLDKYPIVLAGGSFNADTRKEKLLSSEKKMIDSLLKSLNPNRVFFVIGHKLNGYERYLYENRGAFEVYAIVPSDISRNERNKLLKAGIPVRISTESLGMGIYKSFNYEIFERRPSVVIAIEGNSAGANLVQEARNGKAKALIYVSDNDKLLRQKGESLHGYVNVYRNEKDIENMLKNIKKTIRNAQKRV
ncbi:MAG: hypothetical protein IJJ00_00455 [Erysipelotrichaceae bacterium]|nr:hypothetical protein [Erysipelotrichaceae bacterium]